jgi:predicted outer membrane repeat protein
MGRMFILVCAALLAVAGISHAATIHVNWNGTEDYETIGEGMAAAVTGDTVLVAPGTYTGEDNRNLGFRNESFTVMSEGGRRSVTVNPEGQGTGFVFGLGNSVLSGITIQNGASMVGGGINVYGGSPIITDCTIAACTATTTSYYGGGGVFCQDGGTPTFIDVDIISCIADIGGGMCTRESTPSLTRVRFAGNVSARRGGGLYCESAEGTVEITDCVFYSNTNVYVGSGGGGLYLYSSQANISGTTFAWNTGAQGCHIKLYGGSSPTIENCILSFGRVGAVIGRHNEGDAVTTSRCIVYGNEWSDDLVGTYFDILYEDPRFCDVLAGDVTLCSNSSALPGNNVWTVQMGAEGEGCGDCDTPVEDVSWGVLKALWR